MTAAGVVAVAEAACVIVGGAAMATGFGTDRFAVGLLVFVSATILDGLRRALRADELRRRRRRRPAYTLTVDELFALADENWQRREHRARREGSELVVRHADGTQTIYYGVGPDWDAIEHTAFHPATWPIENGAPE